MDCNTREIPLTRGKVALVDAEDYDRLAEFKWYFGSRYAMRGTRKGGTYQNILMHRVILDAPVGLEVDHINGDGLDNRKANLRLATRAENTRNALKPTRSDATSPYKGCIAHEKNWRTAVNLSGRPHYFGTFRTQYEAAKAYDTYATHYFGEFARINFPDEPLWTMEETQRRRVVRPKTSRFTGVSWDKNSGKWAARIRAEKKGKYLHLGYFEDEEKAARAWDAVAATLGRPLNFGG